MQSSPIAEEVKQFIASQFLDGDDEDLEPSSPLLEWGILDSVGMVKLVAHLEDHYGIRIPQSEITPSNFRDVDRISSMVVAHSSRPPEHGADETSLDDPELAELIDFGARSQWLKLDSGALFHTVEMAGDGPVWLLLPEPGETATFYADVQRALEGHSASLAVDLLGCGRSSAANPEPTFWDQAGLLAELMRTRAAERFVLVGHGLSAALAFELARRVPEQAIAVIALGFGSLESPEALVDPSAPAEDFLAPRRRVAEQAAERDLSALTARLSSGGYRSFLDSEARSWVTGPVLDDAPVPALFVAAQQDALVPADCVGKAAERASQAEVKWLARSGHDFPRERADETVSMMLSFMKTLEQ